MSQLATRAPTAIGPPGVLALLLMTALLTVPSPIVAQSDREPLYDPSADPAADLEAAIQEATETRRRIILDVGGNWCGWCCILDDHFEERPTLEAYRDEHYVWLLVSDGTFLHSQGTGVLEEGRGYSDERMWAFLRKWAPEPNGSRPR